MFNIIIIIDNKIIVVERERKTRSSSIKCNKKRISSSSTINLEILYKNNSGKPTNTHNKNNK